MPEKYLYKDKVLQRKEVEDAAKQSGMDIDTYYQKAGLQRVNDNYNFNGKTIPAEEIFEAAKQSQLGFDDYVQKAQITPIEDVKKKELTPSTSLGGQLPVQSKYFDTPFDSLDKTATRQDWELKDPITLAKESKELKNKKKLITSTGGSSFAMGTGGDSYAPDEEAIKQSEKIDKHLKILGYDSRDLNDRLEGIPDYIYNQQGTTQKELLDLYKDNKLKFNRLTSTIKGQAKFLDGIDELYSKGNIDENVKGVAKHNFIQSMDLIHNTTDINEQRRHIEDVVKMVDLYGGENKDYIKRNLGEDMEFAFGRLAGDKDFALENAGSKLSPNQAAALEYIKVFKPDELKKYSTALVDPTKYKDNYEATLGIEEAGKRLDELGIDLRKKYLKEELAPIEKKYQYYLDKDKSEGLTPEEANDAALIQEKGAVLYNQLTKADEDFADLSSKYPTASYYEANNFAQELFGQKNSSYGGLEHFMTTIGKAVENTRLGIYDMVSEPFRTQSESDLRQYEILGKGVMDNNVAYTTQSNTMGKISKPVVSDELQKEIDGINNNKDLTETEKRLRGTELLMDRRGQWQLEPTGKSNLTLKSLYYGVGDMASNLVPFMGLELLTGGGATAGVARKFASSFMAATATGFEETLRAGVEKGVKNPYAWATRVTMINAAAISGAGTADKIRAIFSKQNTPIAKLISKMSNEEIEAALKESPKAFASIKNTLTTLKKGAENTTKSVFHDLKDASKINLYMTGGQVVNDAIDGELKPAGEYMHDFAIETLKFATFSRVTKGVKDALSKPSDMSLSVLYDAAKNKEQIFTALDKKLEAKEIEPEQAAEIKKNVETTAKIINENSIIFKSFNDAAKREYIRNAITARQAKENAKGLPEKQAEKFEMEAEVATFKNGYLIDPKKPSQLLKRKAQLEKSLIPEKDAEGKNIEIPEKEVLAAKAEIKAIEEVLADVKEPIETPTQEVEKLLEPHKDNGMFMGMETPEQKLKFIAEQAQGVMQDGSLHKAGGQRSAMDNSFGKELVDAAIEAFPKETLVKEQKIETPELTTEQKVKELETERDSEVLKLSKPEIEFKRFDSVEVAKLKAQDKILYRKSLVKDALLKKLTECLWK